ncbi:Ethanolaminephosphotransferase 1-like [Oopsacas minuta]|uniref:Ethanolaminephosphotransferase 1-like n=1 Tax=Oopsacas minuta TaxID=111878 RepID=A0AAV7KGZ9_9METZ|nr:Ethanolaminephosphotransferase 1-like [Oopsacas minuta]
MEVWSVLGRYLEGFGIPLIVLYVSGMAGGTAISLLVSLWNVIVSYVNKENKCDSFIDSISPFIPLTGLILVFIIWSVVSPNKVMQIEIRCFCSAIGIAFSNVTCNLIISQMSGVRFRIFNSLVLLAVISLITSVAVPQIEIGVLYAYVIVLLLSHFHFGFVVVKELSSHFKIDVFRIPYEVKNS